MLEGYAMDENEACCKILDGLIDNEMSTVTLLNLYIKMCERLGVAEYRWAHQEIVGYDTIDTVPDYRCVAANDLKVMSEQVTYFEVGMPIYVPRGEWDPLAMMRHLKKVDGLVIQSSHRIIACRAGFEFYEEQRRKDRVDVIHDIKSIPGDSPNDSFSKTMYENVNVTCSRESLIRMRKGLRTRIMNETEALAKKYGLKEGRNMNSNSITVIGNNNQIASACRDVTQTMTISVAKGDWAALSKVLDQQGIKVEDQALLKEALEAEPVPPAECAVDKPRFGAKVSAWMASIMQKVFLGVYNVEIGVMSNMLSAALLKYYGIG